MKDCYKFADLANRDILDKGADKPARLAVLGYPAHHSKSPQMQQAALDTAHLNVRYIRLEVTPEEFPQTIKRLRELDFIGCNVTVPHKQAAQAIATDCDTLSLATHATNTLKFAGDKILGYNTDGPGFIAAIRDQFSLDIKDLKILLLGAAGGAGTAIAYACAQQHCERLILANRTLSKIETLKQKLTPFFIDELRLSGANDRLSAIGLNDHKSMTEALRDADLIVNATSVGLNPTDPSPISSSNILPTHVVFDTLTHLTQLQIEAKNQGALMSNGLPMLVHQGALSFLHWFGISADIGTMKKALAQS